MEGDELKLSADQIPTAGKYPFPTFKVGNWDITPGTDIVITGDMIFTYTYARAFVTFRVVHGKWDNLTAADKTVMLTGYEELKLSADQIPGVGSYPDTNYIAGSWDITPDTETVITEDTIYTYTYVPADAPAPGPIPFFPISGSVLPKTGITMSPENLPNKPASVNYNRTNMKLMIPSLDVVSDIVTVAFTDGEYQVEWLGKDADLLSHSALPGRGLSVIAAHNTLNDTEYGPFALISTLKEGDRFFITRDQELLIYEVYKNAKIDAQDISGLGSIASVYDNTVTLLTCEDERPEGGYASRRIIAARIVE